MHKHIHSMATYPLKVHQLTTQQVGKRGKRRNEFSPTYAQTCPFKGNLPAESAPVENRASGEGRKRRNGSSLNAKSNLEYVQTCSFNGNLPAKCAPVQNTASG